MKGLELSHKFYLEYGAPMIHEQFPDLESVIAVGLVGSGSECMGFDDAISKDHDFEPGFCMFLPDEETVSEMYFMMGDILRVYGYEKYEISNFAHKGRESRHNLKYWERKDYLGFGPAAHSFYKDVRYSHSRDIGAYLRGENIIESADEIPVEEAMDEYVMLGMRLSKGVSGEEFDRIFGISFEDRYGKVFRRFSPEFVTVENGFYRFTDKGMLVSNYILSEA